MGLGLGAGLAGSAGYPDDSTKINVPAYYAASGLLEGYGGNLFVMGALTDYLSFGFWGGLGTFRNSDFKSTGYGGGFRLEVFPLISLVPTLKDLALFTQLGIGSTQLNVTHGLYPEANGIQSFIGGGAFYEWKLFSMLKGHVSAGPSFEVDSIFSRSIERHSSTLGARIAFYGGP